MKNLKELGTLGKTYADGELIVKQGDPADEFYVVQEGKIEIIHTVGGKEVHLAVCGYGEIIGEWSPENSNRHAADIRAKGKTRVMTVHRKQLLRRMHEDPTLAFRILEMMSQRLNDVTQQLIRLHQGSTEN